MDTTITVEAPDAPSRRAIRALLEPTYWCASTPPAAIEAAFEHATVVVVARRGHRIVGAARALSDHARRAMIFDVIVAEDARGAGVGSALVARLLDHAALVDVEVVWLATRDAVGLYERFGFRVLPHASPRPDGNYEMARRRSAGS